MKTNRTILFPSEIPSNVSPYILDYFIQHVIFSTHEYLVLRIGSRIFLIHVRYIYLIAACFGCYLCLLAYKFGDRLGTKLGKFLLERRKNKQSKAIEKVKNIRCGSIHPAEENSDCLANVYREPLEIIDRESLKAVYDLFKIKLGSKVRVLPIDRIIYLIAKIRLFRKTINQKKQSIKKIISTLENPYLSKILLTIFSSFEIIVHVLHLQVFLLTLSSNTQLAVRKDLLMNVWLVIKFSLLIFVAVLVSTISGSAVIAQNPFILGSTVRFIRGSSAVLTFFIGSQVFPLKISSPSSYCLEAFSPIGKIQDSNYKVDVHRLLPVDHNNHRVIIRDNPMLPIFEQVKNNNETVFTTGCDKNLNSLKRFAGRDLDGNRPFAGDVELMNESESGKGCPIIVSNKHKYVPLKERTKTLNDIKIPLDKEILSDLRDIIGEETFINYFGKSGYDTTSKEFLQQLTKLKHDLDKLEKAGYLKTKCYKDPQNQDSKIIEELAKVKNCYYYEDPVDE